MIYVENRNFGRVVSLFGNNALRINLDPATLLQIARFRPSHDRLLSAVLCANLLDFASFISVAGGESKAPPPHNCCSMYKS